MKSTAKTPKVAKFVVDEGSTAVTHTFQDVASRMNALAPAVMGAKELIDLRKTTAEELESLEKPQHLLN